jgi:hypothetical protein
MARRHRDDQAIMVATLQGFQLVNKHPQVTRSFEAWIDGRREVAQ